MNWLKAILARPWAYRLFTKMVGGQRGRETYVRRFIRPWAGARVLDLGCGPGDILSALPDVKYVGVDISPEYIRAAQERYGEKGQFICGSAADFVVGQPRSFDIVLANGVLHHLDDTDAEGLLSVAEIALKPGGRFVSHDGCFTPNQSLLARWMLQNDRGQFVRREEEYLRLASPHFKTIESHILHRLINLPYTHLIMVGTTQAEVGSGVMPAHSPPQTQSAGAIDAEVEGSLPKR